MRVMFALAVVVLAMRTSWAAEPPAEPPPKHVLVEMNCAPDDAVAVRTNLQTALALREDKSDVTLFLDLAAIPLASSAGADQPPKLKAETDRLLSKLRKAGVRILVCPHCAEQQNLTSKSLRPGMRFTNREELEAARQRADQIFEYKPEKANKADDDKVAQDSRTT